jgi:hypothetical protein
MRLLGRLARGIGLALLAAAVLAFGAWCGLAVWFRAGGGAILRDVLACAVIMAALATAVSLATSWRWIAAGGYAAVILVILVWWATITPSGDRQWTPDVARAATATIDGDRVVVSNVRNFTWRSDTDFDPVWEQRTYDLSDVANVDLIMSYWAGETIAHTIISFGFTDGARLAFSIETRKEAGEAYSPIAGFFKEYELSIIAADERDVVRVRSNVRGEDVRLYRLRMTPGDARMLLSEYVAMIDDVAQHPRFYNTLTANCTTLVYDMVRAIHPGLPLDPRILLTGYLPEYAYDLGALDLRVPFDTLRNLSRIHDNALRADTDPAFSRKIREGIPSPQ